MSHNFVPQVRYPGSFPLAEATQVFQYLRRNTDVDFACAAECAWNLQGFVQSMIPHTHTESVVPAFSSGPPAKQLSDAELANQLETCCTDVGTGAASAESMGAAAAIPPWLLPFMPIITEAAMRIIKKFLGL